MSLFGYTRSKDTPSLPPTMLVARDSTKRERAVLRSVPIPRRVSSYERRHAKARARQRQEMVNPNGEPKRDAPARPAHGTAYYWCDPITGARLWEHNPLRNPHAPLVPPPLPTPHIEVPWLERKRPTRPKRAPWSPPAGVQRAATPSFVTGQEAHGSVSSGTTLSVTLPSNTTSGNCIIVVIVGSDIGSNAPIDSLGNQYAVITSNSNTGNCRGTYFFANNCLGGTAAITVTSVTRTYTIAVLEYSGVGSIAGNRTIADFVSGGSSTGSSVSTAMTPQQSGSLLVSTITDSTGGLTWTPGGSLTRRTSVTSVWDLAVGDVVLSSTSVGNGTSAWSSTASGPVTHVAFILRPAGTQAVVRTNGVNQGTAVTSTTFAATAKLGEVSLCVVETDAGGATTIGVIDTAGQTWSPISAKANPSGGELSVWLLNGATATSFTITLSFSGSTKADAFAVVLPGVIPTANLVDQIATNTGNGTAVSVGPTAATTIANETALLFVGSPAGTASAIIGSGGGASLFLANGTLSGSVSGQSLLLSSTGAQTQTCTLPNSVQWSAILITLKTGGVSLVQSINANSTSAGSLPFNVAPGNHLVMGVGLLTSVGVVTAVNDGQGGTWASVGSGAATVNVTGTESIATWHCASAVGGKATFTITVSSGSPLLGIYELSGVGAVDLTAAATGNSANATLTSATPNFLFEVGIATWFANAASITSTATAPMTQAIANSSATSRSAGFGIFSMFSPGAVPSAQTPIFTLSGANQFALSFATFKIAGSGAYDPLQASTAATSAASGAGLVTHNFAAAGAGASTVSSAAKITHNFAAAGAGASTVSSAAKITHNFAGAAAGTSSVGPTLFITHNVVAESDATSVTSAPLLLTHLLAVASAAVSAASSAMSLTHDLIGSSGGVSGDRFLAKATRIVDAFAGFVLTSTRMARGNAGLQATVTRVAPSNAQIAVTRTRDAVVKAALILSHSRIAVMLAALTGTRSRTVRTGALLSIPAHEASLVTVSLSALRQVNVDVSAQRAVNVSIAAQRVVDVSISAAHQ